MADNTHIMDIGLVGIWSSHEDEASQVKYQVAVIDGHPIISATDGYDNENAEVSDVRWDSRTRELHFTCYWSSTGRLAKCRFLRNGENTVHFTYQYTDHELLVRSDA